MTALSEAGPSLLHHQLGVDGAACIARGTHY